MSSSKFFLILFIWVANFQLVLADAKIISFASKGIDQLKVSVPKGVIIVLFDSKSSEFKVGIKPLSLAQNKNNEKCVIETGVKGEVLNISISSENILFNKASCDYEVVVNAPSKALSQTTITSGTADIKIVQIDNDLSITTASGNANVDAIGLKNFNFTSATGGLNGKFKSCLARTDFNLMTATGKMDLYLPKDCALRVDFKSATGKLFNSIGESKEYVLKINGKSASGDLSLLK